jgi:hypothetical protein
MSTKEQLLQDLEKVLAVTEQFKDQMDHKDREVWQDVSASTADERDRVPVPYVLTNASTERPLWEDDKIQFARLLSEIRANTHIAWEDHMDLVKSMDLDGDRIEELFDRAEKVWEKSKQEHCPRMPPRAVFCADCSWEGHEGQVDVPFAEMCHIVDRIEPGGEVPVGTCPMCNALVYYDSDPHEKIRPHLGHIDCLEVHHYGQSESPSSIVVECVKCNEVVAEIFNADNEP